MTTPLATQRMTRPLLTIAAILVSLAYAIWGQERAFAAAVGAGVGLGNWFALRWLMQRLVQSGSAQRAVLSLLLVGKIGLLMAIVFVLISRLALDPIGVAFGLSVLFLGPVVAGLLSDVSSRADASASTVLNPSAAPAAREER